MNGTIHDTVSRLISGPVDPATLAKLLRVGRNDVAEWALALAAVPSRLEPVLRSLEDVTAARCAIDFEDLAARWHAQSEDEWARSVDHWVRLARRWRDGDPSGAALAALRSA